MKRFFLAVFKRTCQNEGNDKLTNDPDDPGGKTRWGISQRSFPRVDIENLTFEKAADLAYCRFWLPGRYADIKNHDLASKTFDLSYNMGGRWANALLQSAVNLVAKGEIAPVRGTRFGRFFVKYLWGGVLKVDGKIGDLSIKTINSVANQEALYAAFIILAGHRYISIYKRKYIGGWLVRLVFK